MNEQKNTFLSVIILITDIVLSIAGFIIGGYLHIGSDALNAEINKYIMVFLIFLIFFFAMYDLYKTRTDEVFGATVSTAFSVLFSSVCAFIASFILKWRLFTPVAWIGNSFIVFVLLVCWRTLMALLIKKYGAKKKCLIIENMNTTSRLARKLKYASNEGRETFYYMIDESNSAEVDKLINEKIKEYDLIFISPAISDEISSRIMSKAFLLDKEISVLADLNNMSTFRGTIYQIDDTPVIEKKSTNINRIQRIIKRSFDIVFAIIMGIVFLPIFLLCAIMIKLDSEGPVFYKQERYTIHKKVFNVYKFRTMVQDAEKNGAQLAQEDDPRITKVGKFLRATRLDELPQIINIFLGSMSVVGPRPERPVFADYFSKMVKDYDIRFKVKAGLTGYAQIYGKYNSRASDKILMDIIYIINYSLLTDIKIILLTGKTMFIKSATEGIDEEWDKRLSDEEREDKRREITVQEMEEKL